MKIINSLAFLICLGLGLFDSLSAIANHDTFLMAESVMYLVLALLNDPKVVG